MKFRFNLLLKISAVLISFAAAGSAVWAQMPDVDSTTTTDYISENGNASGWCQGGPSSYFCMDQVKQQAHSDATQRAEWTCQSRQGRADSFQATCNDFCSPFSIPQGQPQMVTCQSSCTVPCEITHPADETNE